MTARDPALHILQHSLGLDDYGQGNAYRNRFVTGPGGKDWELCMAHADAGRMLRHEPHALFGGDYCFTVTELGRAYVREHSPKPPKLTAGQRRYRAFLSADCSVTFGEWLKWQARERSVGAR